MLLFLLTFQVAVANHKLWAGRQVQWRVMGGSYETCLSRADKQSTTYRKIGISGRIPVVVWVAEFQRNCRGFSKLVEEGDQTGSNYARVTEDGGGCFSLRQEKYGQ